MNQPPGGGEEMGGIKPPDHMGVRLYGCGNTPTYPNPIFLRLIFEREEFFCGKTQTNFT